MSVYIRSTEADSKGKFWWHSVSHWNLRVSPESYMTQCGQKISPVIMCYPPGDAEHLTLADWDRLFGDDVDLCECAVTAPEDRVRVLGIPSEETDLRAA